MQKLRTFVIAVLIALTLLLPIAVSADTPAAPAGLNGIHWAFNDGCTILWSQSAQPVVFHVYLNGVYLHTVQYQWPSNFIYQDSFYCGPNSARNTIDVYAQDGEGDWSAKAEVVLQPV